MHPDHGCEQATSLSGKPTIDEHQAAASDSKRQITTGAILSYLTLLLSTVSGLMVTPYMLRSLGKSQYGLYMLIGSIVGYLSFLDFGISNSIVRYVARYRALNDRVSEQNFICLALMSYSGIALLAAALGMVLYANLKFIFGATFTAEEIRTAKIMLLILIANLSLSFPSGAFTAIITGHERFAFAKSLGIAKLVLRTVLLVVLLYLGFKAIAIVVLDTLISVALFALNITYVLTRLRLRFTLHKFDRKLIYEVLHYSFWAFVALVFTQLYTRVGQIVLGIKDGTASVAVFAVGALIVSYHTSLGYVFSNLLLPHASKMVARGATPNVLTDFMIKIGRLQFFIVSYVLGGFVVLGWHFIALWVGQSYQNAWIIATLMIAPATLTITRDFGVAIQQAQNRNVFRSFYCAFLVLSTAGLGIAARHLMDGAIAMAVGDMLTVTIGHGVMILYYSRIIKLEMARFHREVFLPQVYCLALAMLLSATLAHFVPPDTWALLAEQAALYSFAFAFLTWRFAMNLTERTWLARLWASATERTGLSLSWAK